MTTKLEAAKALIPAHRAAVQLHAQEPKNYENGWDIVVECMSNREIDEIVQWASTERGAINLMGRYVKTYTSYRRDIEATAF